MNYLFDFNAFFSRGVLDEEPEYPSSELNSHGPAVVGWRCRPHSTLSPKEIILRFEKAAVICRIQVLAHQCMIPERIELYIHHATRGAPTTPSSQTYDFLGFIALSDNSATNYKSRELQSVPVGPKKGTHLKLRFSSPYPNEMNKSNQVRCEFPRFFFISFKICFGAADSSSFQNQFT